MREKYLSLSLGSLKELAKARGMKGISTLKKSELVERLLQEDEKEKKPATSNAQQAVKKEEVQQTSRMDKKIENMQNIINH